MKDKPQVSDDTLIEMLKSSYGIPVSKLEFLPLGYDAMAAVYRVETQNEAYFLKLKRTEITQASLRVPRYLKSKGIEQIVAPLETKTGALSIETESFTLILYPFIEGDTGMKLGLSDKQWLEYGQILRAMHNTEIPDELAAIMRKENFVPKNPDLLNEVLMRGALQETYQYPCQLKLALFIRERMEEIRNFKAHGAYLGRMLQKEVLPFGFAHADIHTANIMVSTDGKLHLVDWDDVMIAPKERDLMFLTGNSIDGRTKQQEALFFEGYGETEVNKLAMAYYRYDWGVQDMGEFGREVFFLDFFSEEAKAHSAEMFIWLFSADNTIDAAYEAERRAVTSRRRKR
jgi:spectinomycin phosphotransferase